MSIQRNIRDLVKILEELGARAVTVITSGKHLKFRVEGPEGSRLICTSMTPSDHRTVLNFKAQARRALREIGIVPA
jgi:uncharacterized radical SAM superfamily Fe-S cluster-containing enzyme